MGESMNSIRGVLPKRRAIAGALSILCGAMFVESARGDSNDELVDAIMAHQRLYEHAQIHYHVMRTKLEEGEVVAASNSPVMDVVLTVDGDRMRRDVTHYDPARTRQTTAVTDSEQVREWRRSSDDPVGQGTLMPFDNVAEAVFGLGRFYRHKVLNFETMDVLEDNGDVVTIEYSVPPHSRAVCRYERVGEYLRLLSYQPYYRQAPDSTEWEELTSFFYEYPPPSQDESQPTGPSEVRQITTSRDSYVLLKVLDVDFNPDIADDAFEQTFPEGCWVRDKNSGARWRIREILSPGTPQEDLVQQNAGDVTGVRLVCPTCALSSQAATGTPTIHCPACDAVFAVDW